MSSKDKIIPFSKTSILYFSAIASIVFFWIWGIGLIIGFFSFKKSKESGVTQNDSLYISILSWIGMILSIIYIVFSLYIFIKNK